MPWIFDAYRILLFTKVSFSDFSVTVTGKSGDVRKNDFINFLVTYHPGTRRLTVHSDMFNDTNEKFLKEGFLAAIFSGRESVSTDTSELFED